MRLILSKYFIFLFFVCTNSTSFAQTSYESVPKPIVKLFDIFIKVEDSLKKQFASKKLQWPASEMYVRSFKYDRQLEVWVKTDDKETFKLFKTYKV